MKNNEFKITKTNDATVYTLESASSGGTSSGSVASISSPMGGVRKRGDNLISQEAQEKESPKPRNFVAKNAKMGGAGQHKDKKKEKKQGVAKHKKPYMEEMDDLKSQFLSILKDKGIQHRVHGSPDQEKQRTKDMIAQKGSPSKPSAPSTSSAYRDGFQDGLRGHRNPRASNIHGPMSNDYDSGYHAGVMKKENGTTDEADFNTNREGMAEGDGDEAYVACIVQHNRSGRAIVHRTKPINHERAEEVIRHALSKNTFVHPPFMTIYPASAGKLDGSTIMAQFPDMSQKGLAEADGDEAYVACIVQHNRSGRAMVHRTKPISHERAEEVIRNALAKNTFVHPPFMTIYPASAGKLDGSTIMAQFPDMSQKGLAEGKADYNFDIEDLKRLERIRDLPTLKTQAMALISKPSVKPMKPEKVEWFKNALDNQRMNSPMKVIKLMYDLLLSGEGNAVVGTRSSMNPNSYRQRFGEQGVEEGWGMGGYATAIGSEIQPGKGHEMGENDEYDGEGSMIKNDLHTIVRVSTHLAKALTDDENLPTWVIEKIAQTKGMIVSVMDYMISQHEMGQVYQKENHPDEKEDKALIRKMVKQRALKQETNDPYMAELHAQLAEKIPKNAPVKTYIDDFAKASKTPNAKGHHQFKNKSPEKVRQMAIAASYGAKNPSKKKK